ncbi:triphosphoribosyl-dephospho-CoA synthase MdcB [Sphingomonas sp. PvP056]|uniref:triphosphoribosyl-dephospho-CoA synthase MdcB n=1 Tax=Sphingomonas sp. PvP056 TaxID=3156392 RepID=UPI0033948C1D
MTAACASPAPDDSAEAIGALAADCLIREVETWPKPGLVSHVDSGAHDDMDVDTLRRSARVLAPYFADLAAAGANGAGMDRLRAIGIAAEASMRRETGGVNTHRGAIFGLGLLAAAAGFRARYGVAAALGGIVMARWGAAIIGGPVDLHSHGSMVARRYQAGGARVEAAAGFPSIYGVALPALAEGRRLARDEEAARVHACMTLIAQVEDSNLLYRGGPAGLAYAQREARAFLAAGGVGASDWRVRAAEMHDGFVARRLSPGGCADLLAMALFVEAIGG